MNARSRAHRGEDKTGLGLDLGVRDLHNLVAGCWRDTWRWLGATVISGGSKLSGIRGFLPDRDMMGALAWRWVTARAHRQLAAVVLVFNPFLPLDTKCGCSACSMAGSAQCGEERSVSSECNPLIRLGPQLVLIGRWQNDALRRRNRGKKKSRVG